MRVKPASQPPAGELARVGSECGGTGGMRASEEGGNRRRAAQSCGTPQKAMPRNFADSTAGCGFSIRGPPRALGTRPTALANSRLYHPQRDPDCRSCASGSAAGKQKTSMPTDQEVVTMVNYTIPGIKKDTAETLATLLQDRLNALNDLALTLKHVHWNVVGPNFIAVHTMLDPQVDAVRLMVDDDSRADRDPRRLAGRHAGRAGRASAAGMTTRSGGPTRSRIWAPGPGLRRGHRGAPRGHRGDRGAGPGHPGHADRAVGSAGAVPLVRAGPSRERRAAP